MTLDRTQAAQALADMDETQRRSSSLYGYSRAAPYIFIAGLMWLTADLWLQFGSFDRDLAWPVTETLACVAMVAVAVLQTRRSPLARSSKVLARIVGCWIAVFLFFLATFAVLPPASGRQVHTFFGLFFGFAYLVVGLFRGWRLAALGGALAALSLFGDFEVRPYFLAYMGVVGGGALMLGGLWLRSV